MQDLFKKLMLLLVSTIIGLMIVEGAVRALELAPRLNRLMVDTPNGAFETSRNPKLRWVPKQSHGDISSYGIRDREYSLKKPEGTFRIVVLGDSVAYGYCNAEESVPRDAIFPAVLEKLLRTESGDLTFEVINLAVSGYDTHQEVEFLVEKGLALAPDLVIVSFCMNDYVTNFSSEFDALRAKGYDFDLAEAVARSAFLNSHLVRLVWLELRNPSEKSRTPQDPDVAFARLQELGNDHGFNTVVVLFPLFEDYEQARKASDGIFDLHELRHEARMNAEKSGFSVLDLYGPFMQYAPVDGSGNWPLRGRCTGSHPDENGHKFAAEEIAKYLNTNRLVPAGISD